MGGVLPTMPMWGSAPGRLSPVWLWCGGHAEVGRYLRSTRNRVTDLGSDLQFVCNEAVPPRGRGLGIHMMVLKSHAGRFFGVFVGSVFAQLQSLIYLAQLQALLAHSSSTTSTSKSVDPQQQHQHLECVAFSKPCSMFPPT